MYKIDIKSKDDYHTIINYLFEICDKFKVVNVYGDAKNIEKSKFADELNSFCIEEKKFYSSFNIKSRTSFISRGN